MTLAWLDGLVARMNGAAAITDTTLKALKDVGPIRMGRKTLDNACDDFQDELRRAVKDLRKELESFGEGIADARARYGATEQAVIDALSPQVPTSPATPGAITQALG